MGSIWKQAVADVAALLRCSALKAALRRSRLKKAPARPEGRERKRGGVGRLSLPRKLRSSCEAKGDVTASRRLEPRQMLTVATLCFDPAGTARGSSLATLTGAGVRHGRLESHRPRFL